MPEALVWFPSIEGAVVDPCPRIRVTPEDFRVDEVALYPTSGEGAHTFVRVEKRLRDTDEVLRALARASGVAPRDVGCAGRKDRRAVTRQWFSVPDLDPVAALELELPGARVLEAQRHPHKLRTGHLSANRFEIQVRDVLPEQAQRASDALERLVRVGMPNRFGSQRFGRQGANLERGREILTRGRVRGDRRKARFMVSALQAAVFNAVLEQRPLGLDRVELGDVARVVESGGLFLVEDLELENPRAASFEISATGPIFGTKMKCASGEVAAREAAAMVELGVPDGGAVRPPRGIRLAGARRSLRVRPASVSFEHEPERAAVWVKFELPPGSYATVLLEEIFGELAEGEFAGPKDEAVDATDSEGNNGAQSKHGTTRSPQHGEVLQ
jgi:tRNA pseudouridine13 synthase